MAKRIILFVIGGLLMFGLFGCSKVPNVKNKELISYVYSSGGGMKTMTSLNISWIRLSLPI